jgi:hypothetical protein
MAWTKGKTAVVAVAAVIVATGTTTLAIRHQLHHVPRLQPKPQLIATGETDFPKTSWVFAGYADPASALMSAMWTLNAGDFDTFMASLTPGERERQLKQLKSGAEKAGKPVAAFFSNLWTQGDMPTTRGFRIVDQQNVSDEQMNLRVSIQGPKAGKQEEIVTAKMIRMGNEWKLDSLGPQ